MASVCEVTTIMHSTIKHVLPLTTNMSREIALEVEGMSCGHCVNAVETLVLSMDGIENVNVDLGSKTVNVFFKSSAINTQAIIEIINSSEIYKATEK